MAAQPTDNPPSNLESTGRRSIKRSLTLGIVFIAILLACWSGSLERFAQAEAESALQRVVIAFGLARTLNGVISVAQGTEIALQPAGVGVTLTAGEVLDPLNDLVERFSILALTASISLQGQILLAELLSTHWVNLLLSACIGLYLATAFVPGLSRFERVAARITSLVIFTRLIFVVVMFTANWLGNLTLTERHDTAVAELTQTREDISSINAQAPTVAPTTEEAGSDSLLDRVSGFFSEQRDAFDISARLDAVLARAEDAVSHLITLSVLFLLQYVALPIGAFWLATFCVRTAWSLWWRVP